MVHQAPLTPFRTMSSNLADPKANDIGVSGSKTSFGESLSDSLHSLKCLDVVREPGGCICQGWCRLSGSGDVPLAGREITSPKLADVISFGSCKDSELSWESEEGIGMTQALIQVLRKDPHPTLRDLVTDVSNDLLSHTLHGLARDRHLRAKVWKKYRDAHVIKSSGLGSFDTETFQHPQIASHKPLDMDRKWNI
ncbi:hypothetical protein B0H12DRAFT_1263094 [Mycena haematopus]|nr:hypothetical protein B0H12DRAFT_1263094 [Mycena haematopus]